MNPRKFVEDSPKADQSHLDKVYEAGGSSMEMEGDGATKALSMKKNAAQQ